MAGGPFHSILITGASSGLGYALALGIASSNTTLYLSGKNEERLNRAVSDCLEKGAIVHSKIIDVTNKAHMRSWIETIPQLDLVIANAGISGGTSGHKESSQQTHLIFETNVQGVINTLTPAIEKMIQQRSGQLAIMSSMASFLPLSGCPAYASSKAAIRYYGESLRHSLAAFNIGVTVICPGYIKTPMTEKNHFPMPLICSAEDAASIIYNKLKQNPSRIIFPKAFYCFTQLIDFLPHPLKMFIIKQFPSKSTL